MKSRRGRLSTFTQAPHARWPDIDNYTVRTFIRFLKSRRIFIDRIFILAFTMSSGITGCISPPPLPPARSGFTKPTSYTIRIQIVNRTNARIARIPLEDYVAGSILAELSLGSLDPPVAERMAKVQAIVSRTYTIANLGRHAKDGFDLCATTHCQLFHFAKSWPTEISLIAKRAAAATAGLLIMYEHEPIQALFHSNCGGHTSPAGSVWGGTTPPYLQAVPDDFCSTSELNPWRFDVATDRLLNSLNQNTRTSVGSHLNRITVVERDKGGRAARIILDGERSLMVRGEEFRAALTTTFGIRSIRSTRFTVSHEAEQFVFEGSGFGHGVGLCQAGAIARARASHSPQQIIQHYYPGTRSDYIKPNS